MYRYLHNPARKERPCPPETRRTVCEEKKGPVPQRLGGLSVSVTHRGCAALWRGVWVPARGCGVCRDCESASALYRGHEEV